MPIADSKRIQWIDAAKFVGIFLVACGHSWLNTKFTFYFYSFHMPLFFIIAGITLSTKRMFKDFTWRKIKALIVPYFIFALFLTAIYYILSLTHHGDYNPLYQAQRYVLQQRHMHLWFLPTLFLAEIVAFFVLISPLNKVRWFVFTDIIAILFIIHGFMVHGEINKWIWNIDMIPVATAFVLVGVMYQRYQHKLLIENNLLYVAAILLLSIVVATVNWIDNDSSDMFYNKYGYYPLFIVGAIAGSYALILILKRVTLPQWMLFIGGYSILYYAFHRVLMENIDVLFSKMGINHGSTSWFDVCVALGGIIITFAILYPFTKFISRKAPWFIGKF